MADPLTYFAVCTGLQMAARLADAGAYYLACTAKSKIILAAGAAGMVVSAQEHSNSWWITTPARRAR